MSEKDITQQIISNLKKAMFIRQEMDKGVNDLLPYTVMIKEWQNILYREQANEDLDLLKLELQTIKEKDFEIDRLQDIIRKMGGVPKGYGMNICCEKFNSNFYDPASPWLGKIEYKFCPECGESLTKKQGDNLKSLLNFDYIFVPDVNDHPVEKIPREVVAAIRTLASEIIKLRDK